MKYINASGKNFDKFIKVSDEDYDNLSRIKWSVNSSGYATNGKIYMHQLIMPKIDGRETEHKDGDKLNNQRDNLRYATRSQNHANRKKKIGTVSKYKGVSFKGDTFRKKPWRAKIGKNYQRYILGNFKTEKEAALAYNKKAIELFGEFANINIF